MLRVHIFISTFPSTGPRGQTVVTVTILGNLDENNQQLAMSEQHGKNDQRQSYLVSSSHRSEASSRASSQAKAPFTNLSLCLQLPPACHLAHSSSPALPPGVFQVVMGVLSPIFSSNRISDTLNCDCDCRFERSLQPRPATGTEITSVE